MYNAENEGLILLLVEGFEGVVIVKKTQSIVETAAATTVVEVGSNLPVAPKSYAALVEEWLAFLKKYSSVKSDKSERSYRNAVKQLFIYLAERGVNPMAATEPDISGWLEYLRANKAAATVQMYLVAVRLFYAFLHAQNYIAVNPCKAGDLSLKAGVKIRRDHKRDYLSVSKAKELIAAMPAQTEKDLRDRAIVGLMLTSGLRCIEVAKALYEDLRTAGDDDVLYILGKGHSEKDAFVKVVPAVMEMIREYLAARYKGGKPRDRDYLFVSTSRNHAKLDKDDELSTQAIRAIAKAAFKKIGYDDRRHTAHSLRHTAATLMLRADVPLEEVQTVMRHENIQTTLNYAHALRREKINAELAVSNLIFGQ